MVLLLTYHIISFIILHYKRACLYYSSDSISTETPDLDTLSRLMMDRMDEILNNAICEKKVCFCISIEHIIGSMVQK